MSSRVLWEEDLHRGGHWSGVIRRGTTLRMTDMDGPAAAVLDVIVLISNCPQLNNSCNAFNPTPVRLMVWDA
jgi:uncharacterized protein YcgI (DUF1989 family)